MQNFLRIQGNVSENQFYIQGSNSTALVNSYIVVIDCLRGEYFNSETQLCELCGFGSYTLLENSMKCQQCPDNTICLGGMDISINEGFWRSSIYSDVIVKCDDVMNDKICLGGNSKQICKQGNIGALCQECDLFGEQWVDSYYSQFGNYEKCTTCKSQIKSIIIQTVFLSLFFMISMSWTIKKNMYIVFVKLTQTHMLSLGFLSKGIDQPSFIIKIFNHYMQITGIITTFKLASFNQITLAFNFLSSPILFSESSFDCMLKDYDSSIVPHIYLKVIVQNLFFIGLVLSFFLIFLIIKALKLTNYKFHHVLYTTLTYCFIILQPSILNQLFKLLSCRTIAGQQYMTYYMNHLCWNQEHLKFSFSFIFPLIFLLIFIIPGLFIRILYQNIKKEKLNSVDIRFSYGILYNEYTDEQSFWEIIKIFEKVIIISVTQIFGEQDVLKGVFVILILFAYALLNIKYQPYQTPMLNNLDLQQTVISSITILTALLIKQSSDITTTIIGLIFVFIVNAYLFLMIFRYLLMGYTQIFEVKIEQIKELIITKFPKAGQYIKLKREIVLNTKKNWAVLRKHFQNFTSLKKQGKFVTAQVVTTQAYLENPQVFENLVKKNNQNNQMFIETFIVNESIKKYDRKAVVMTQNQLMGLQMFASILDRQKKKDFIKKKTMRSETVQDQKENEKDDEEEEEEEQENINTQEDQEEEEDEEEDEEEEDDDDDEEDNQKSEFKEDQSKGSNTNVHEDLESEEQNNTSSHKTEVVKKEEKSVDTTANEDQQNQEGKNDKTLRMQKSKQFTSIYFLNQMINDSYNISQNQQNDSSILPCLNNEINIEDADVDHIDDKIPSIKRFEEINQNFKRSQLSDKNL
ncbi:GCC2 and GCC3 protein (macronuclear) [Tetrahymena thermophila SB210]|uniref:GCC2 and GCC3 protein n=1 Tax=Tetrahymena thermophila (strain SB210) TaxID=312017 RepID=Q237R3_TETTS|nr:GCC2 and GCC3 protein [Tetrahymena thermophila SB210]EAR92678.2 GCC2 and GCC3 protein [Tetrahymena thermophila SB210]|eukprot:XP_001012923.2 GCC2 and GCC3 protein [Tetrahymena thermophila SB210]